MTANQDLKLPVGGRLNSRTLAKAIFAAEVPEKFIREVPAQSLYLTVKHNGLLSSADLLEIASLKQCRLLIDFDCWRHDRFNEDNFWEWLAVTDAANSLVILEKLLRFVDLKIIAMMIAKHVECLIQEEPSEQPPREGFYTPDKGYTWLNITEEDGTKHFLLARLLALIFETDPELFYQLIAIPNVSTYSTLEEESYQDRQRRLSEEGIPDRGLAFELNSPISIEEIRRLLLTAEFVEAIKTPMAIQPLVYDQLLLRPLADLFKQEAIVAELEAELTMLMNAAIVRWEIDFDQASELYLLTQKVKGALNLGLERAMQLGDYCVDSVYKTVGLTKIYRFGLAQLFNLRDLVQQRQQQLDSSAPLDHFRLSQLRALMHPFPHTISPPEHAFTSSISEEAAAEPKAIETLFELQSLVQTINCLSN